MPIPPAHPAAVLPLRRLCPRRLDFSALVIGSVVPDVAYAIDDINKFSRTVGDLFGPWIKNTVWLRENWDWDDFSHTITGGLCFDLPAGILALVGFILLRRGLVSKLPDPHRSALLPLCARPRASIATTLVSLLIGIASHIGWDQLTSGDRWLAQHWSILNAPVFHLGWKAVTVHRIIWFLSSAGGTLVCIGAYIKFLHRQPSRGLNPVRFLPYLMWAAAVGACLLIAHEITVRFLTFDDDHFVYLHRLTGYFIAAMSCALIGIGVVGELNLRSRTNRGSP